MGLGDPHVRLEENIAGNCEDFFLSKMKFHVVFYFYVLISHDFYFSLFFPQNTFSDNGWTRNRLKAVNSGFTRVFVSPLLSEIRLEPMLMRSLCYWSSVVVLVITSNDAASTWMVTSGLHHARSPFGHFQPHLENRFC